MNNGLETALIIQLAVYTPGHNLFKKLLVSTSYQPLLLNTFFCVPGLVIILSCMLLKINDALLSPNILLCMGQDTVSCRDSKPFV